MNTSLSIADLGTATDRQVTFGTSTTTEPSPARHTRRDSASKEVEEAVLAYIEAMRHVGKTVVNTAEIADALSVSLRLVELAAANLKEKGVRPIR